MKRFAPSLLVALLLAVPAGSALAQTDLPAMGSSADITGDAIQPESTDYQILVIGDVLGGGLGAGLMRYGEANPGIVVTNRFVEESGIARPEVYDWSATLPKILEGKGYNAIVVLLGSNDRQMIKQDNFRFGFNSPEWVKAYRRQMDQVLDEMAASGAAVYWVSLPPMGDPDYDAAMRAVTAIQKERVEAHHMKFIDIRQAFLASDGSYTDAGPDDTGEVRKLRSRDGVTFFKQGNNRMAQLVMAAVNEGMREQPAPVESEAAPPAAEPARPEEPRVVLAPPPEQVPTFGQLGGGEANPVLVAPAEVASALASATTSTFQLGNGTLRDLAAIAAPGSAAAKLFGDGTSAAAPSGRIDDFALPAAP